MTANKRIDEMLKPTKKHELSTPPSKAPSKKPCLDDDDDDDLPPPSTGQKTEKVSHGPRHGTHRPSLDDSDSDSDSEIECEKKNRRRHASSHNPISRKNTSDIKKKLARDTPIHNKPDGALSVTDIFSMGELNTDLLADIERGYTKQYWVESNEPDLPLYVADELEEERATLMEQGIFNNPKSFAVIRKHLARAPASNATPEQLRASTVNLYSIEPIPREWDEKMLWEASDGEKPCMNGTGCQCYEWFGFVLKEFLTPLEVSDSRQKIDSLLSDRRDGRKKDAPDMCLLCHRKAVAMIKTTMKLNGEKNRESYVYQKFRNMVNLVGEYLYLNCLTLDNGLLYPVVENYKGGYEVVSRRGLRGLIQTEKGYPRCTQEDIERLNFLIGTLPQEKIVKEKSSSDESAM